MNLAAVVSVWAVLAAAVPAQGRLFVVDAAGGPGSHFRRIDRALRAASDGDRVLVRKGTYPAFKVTKGVSIVGLPGVIVRASYPDLYLEVSRVAAGRDVRIRNLELQAPLHVRDCAARVLVEGVNASGLASLIQRSGQVLLQRVLLSAVMVEGSTISIANSYSRQIQAKSSRIVLADCWLHGWPRGLQWGSYYPATPPLSIDAATRITITGGGVAPIEGGDAGVPAIEGAGRVDLDPRVPIRNYVATGVVFDRRLRVTRRAIPYLEATSATLGRSVRVRMQGGARHVFALALGMQGNRIAAPTLGGEIWLDPRAWVVFRVGALDARGTFRASVSVPNDPTLFGLGVVWQGVAGPNAGALAVTNPSAYVHGL